MTKKYYLKYTNFYDLYEFWDLDELKTGTYSNHFIDKHKLELFEVVTGQRKYVLKK